MNARFVSSLLAKVAMALASTLAGALLIEVGYRTHLHRTQSQRFLPALGGREHPSFWYLQDSPYRHSEPFGYEYVPGEFDGGYVREGRVVECYEPLWVNNAQGNPGRIRGSYEDADLRILAFGDSWTQTQTAGPDGVPVTWPNLLQELLEQRLETSVHVVNFARDGYGILQMFDLAAARIPEWKPDLAIVAFITNDLGRGRFWRSRAILDGRDRILVSETPDPHPDPSRASDLNVLHSKATREWCRRLWASQAEDDPIVLEMEQTLLEARRRSSLLADPWSLTQSFVADLLVHGDPFHTTLARAPASTWPRHSLQDFAADARTVENVERLNAAGIPLVLIHLAFYPELKAGREYVGNPGDLERNLALVESLNRLTASPVHRTLDHVPVPVLDPEGLSRDFPNDHHPSMRGMRFYAELVAAVLERHGHLRVGLPRSSGSPWP